MKTGEKIRKLRLEKGMSQKELSKNTGIQYPMISHYEQSHVKASIENKKSFEKIAKVLDVDIMEILGDDAEELKLIIEGKINLEEKLIKENKFQSQIITKYKNEIEKLRKQLENKEGIILEEENRRIRAQCKKYLEERNYWHSKYAEEVRKKQR